MDKKTIARFWNKVEKRGPDECWEWRAARTKAGYGALYHKQGLLLAHRLSLRIAGVEIPEASFVLHSCDNPGCVNPAHLRAGTHRENMADRTARNPWKPRTFRGEEHGYTQLSNRDVLAIRAARADGATLATLAVQYGVHQSTIWMIVKRKTWQHI